VSSRGGTRAIGTQRVVDWSFGHYLEIAPPEFARAPGAHARPNAAQQDVAA
jgi:hypothetical protein